VVYPNHSFHGLALEDILICNWPKDFLNLDQSHIHEVLVQPTKVLYTHGGGVPQPQPLPFHIPSSTLVSTWPFSLLWLSSYFLPLPFALSSLHHLLPSNNFLSTIFYISYHLLLLQMIFKLKVLLYHISHDLVVEGTLFCS
jgi:hypothetical protein